ncbi:hypothetical protein ACY2DA_00615 [Staphylococcus simulans]
MSDVFDFIWNLIVIAVTGGFFIIVVGTMMKVLMMLIYVLMPYVIYPFLKIEKGEGAKWFALLVSTILASVVLFTLIFITAKVIGNGVLFLFFFLGLYFMFRSYQKKREAD